MLQNVIDMDMDRTGSGWLQWHALVDMLLNIELDVLRGDQEKYGLLEGNAVLFG
jgi:hypothetical protein